jgi:hypothetical protein
MSSQKNAPRRQKEEEDRWRTKKPDTPKNLEHSSPKGSFMWESNILIENVATAGAREGASTELVCVDLVSHLCVCRKIMVNNNVQT